MPARAWCGSVEVGPVGARRQLGADGRLVQHLDVRTHRTDADILTGWRVLHGALPARLVTGPDTTNNAICTAEVTRRLDWRTSARPTLPWVSDEAPETPTALDETHARAVLARRVEFLMIGLGGVFIIFGWGFGQQEWARALGWIFTGIGFAIEMVYGKVIRPARKGTSEPAAPADPAPAAQAGTRASDESAS
jgi:hypothetical protein